MSTPPLLSLQDIHLSFGGPSLLSGADLFVHERDRVALIGRNGSGKSTLMKIAAGMIEADQGDRFVQPGITVRYLEQDPDFTRFGSALEAVEDGLAEGDLKFKAQLLLDQMGLTGKEDPKRLSGGEGRRVALARALAPDPDILLLDEPTNHLDLPTIDWLEETLRQNNAALVLISHDRRFLEGLSKRMVWLDRGASRTLNRGFKAFEDWRDEVLDAEEEEQHKLKKKIQAEEHWLRHGVSGRRKRNVRRLGQLRNLRTERVERRARRIKEYKLNVGEGEVSGHRVILARNVTKRFGERTIIQGFDTMIMRGDRVGLVGPNGAGKTTLLKMLTGDMTCDEGRIKLGTNLDIISLDQQRKLLDPRLSIYETLTEGQGEMLEIGDETRHVYGYMKDFLFPPNMARTPVSALSGGERGRLALAVAMTKRSNLLVLDEPTNDLDIETLDLLEEMVSAYEGTVLLVSHDRDFLDRAVSSVIAPDPVAEAKGQEGVWAEYAGGYSDMKAQQQAALDRLTPRPERDDTPKKSVSSDKKPNNGFGVKPTSKGGKAKLSYKDQYALDTLPKTIETLEAEIAKLEQALAAPDAYAKDAAKFQATADRLAAAKAKRDAAEEQWLELEMKREEIEAAG
ncbi:MAG: ATP-binding cassette domain-containing protein [Pseudomonadota bacterium]